MDESPQKDPATTSSIEKDDSEMASLVKMTQEELYKECMALKKENGQLNCRLLGVNELARLLQEKTEAVETFKDKNKRLELAVVRLENRCSNMDKKSKTQNASPSSLPSLTNRQSQPQGGQQQQQQQQQQNPFIPGPSKQILETLMRENTDLKKTLDNMTKKGPTGYREAVKMNQLEEVIDQKNEKIEMLNGQLQSLTATTQKEGEADIGTLQRQLLKMEHSMKVKDRFCTLLSDRVNQLQKELNDNKKEFISQPDSGLGQTQDTSLDTLTKEHIVKERNMRRMIDELQHQVERERDDKINAITQAEDNRQKLIEKQNDFETLQSKYDDSILYTDSLLNEKMTLMQQLEKTKNETDGDTTDPSSRSNFQREIENKNMQIDQLKRLLEDAQYKYALAESKHVHFERIEELEDKVKDLEEERSGLEGELFECKRKIQELMHHNTRLRFGNLGTHTPFMLKTGGAPSIDLRSHHGEDVIADSSKSLHDTIKDTIRHEVPPLNSRDVGTDGSTDVTSASPATPTYTTSDTTSRTLHVSSTNPTSSVSSSSASVRNYRTNVPNTPIMAPHVYPGSNSTVMGGGSGGVYQQQDMTPRHLYQPSDAALYQTHSGGTPMSGYVPQFSTGGSSMNFSGMSSNRVGGMGLPPTMQRSISSSPGPYMSSSGGFAIHSSSVPTSNTIFGQQGPSYGSLGGSGTIFGSGMGSSYATTPTTYVPQYLPSQPGQRYDISQHYGGSGGFANTPYGMTPMQGGGGSAGTNPTSSGGYSTSPQPPPTQGGVPPPSGGQMQRRHSPPDPR